MPLLCKARGVRFIVHRWNGEKWQMQGGRKELQSAHDYANSLREDEHVCVVSDIHGILVPGETTYPFPKLPYQFPIRG